MATHAAMKTVIDALDEPSLLVDGTRIVAANAAAQALLGPRGEGADIRLVLRHPHALEQILETRSGDVEVYGIVEAERPWIVSVRPAGGSALLVRLTDRSVLRAAEKMRVDFVANASHELRTPLATIMGYAETIADGGDLDCEAHTRFGAIIRSEAERMLQIVEDLMSLSRIEADRFVPPREQVSVADLVERAAANAQPLAGRRKCRVETRVEPGLPPIAGDAAQLVQLLDNLIANGLRYGCNSAGCAVTVTAAAEPTTVVLTVADSGSGIAPEHLPRLTERFYRVDAARSRDAGGTGLGLAIVKHIVERHRGVLEIGSVLGRGTEVVIRFPRR